MIERLTIGTRRVGIPSESGSIHGVFHLRRGDGSDPRSARSTRSDDPNDVTS
jgi:hypothetical protein